MGPPFHTPPPGWTNLSILRRRDRLVVVVREGDVLQLLVGQVLREDPLDGEMHAPAVVVAALRSARSSVVGNAVSKALGLRLPSAMHASGVVAVDDA